MTQLNLSVDEVLSTTRAVRKRLDLSRPVELDVVKECLELALQAPSASNSQSWQFMVVTDPDKRAQIAELYRQAFDTYINSDMAADKVEHEDPGSSAVQQRVMSSAAYLAEHLQEVPVLLIPCLLDRFEDAPAAHHAAIYGSIFPALWSFMLAGRERGLGTCLTTLHLFHEREIAEILGIPYAQVTQIALVPVAYTLGTDFRVAPRKPLADSLHLDNW